jgi:hypothetical protein
MAEPERLDINGRVICYEDARVQRVLADNLSLGWWCQHRHRAALSAPDGRAGAVDAGRRRDRRGRRD